MPVIALSCTRSLLWSPCSSICLGAGDPRGESGPPPLECGLRYVLGKGIALQIYAYVDGESHFVRSESLWKELHGADARLSDVVSDSPGVGSSAYPIPGRPYIRIDESAKFFWDTRYPDVAPHPFKHHNIQGAAYYTAFSGDKAGHHAACVNIRKNGFDPRVTHELSQLAGRRNNSISNAGLIEKPKGVDIGLSVRLIEDAYQNIFSECYLFTSDIDFLPVIETLQRIGKKVIVFGYMDGLGRDSQLEYVPDAFVDLGEFMQQSYQRATK